MNSVESKIINTAYLRRTQDSNVGIPSESYRTPSGFGAASHYGPTVFKTASSPPGHTAYRGDEDRTHTYGIKTRCEVGIPSESYRTPNGVWSSITLRPYHDRREIRTPESAKTSRLPNIGICSKSLSHLLRRFGRVHSSTMLSGHTTAGGFEPPEQFSCSTP